MTRIDSTNTPALPTAGDEEFVGPMPPTCTPANVAADKASAASGPSVSAASPETDAWEEPSKPSLFDRARNAATGGLERAREALGDATSTTRKVFEPVVDFLEPSPATTEAIAQARQSVEEAVTRVTDTLDPDTLEKTARAVTENPELLVRAIEVSIDEAQATVDAARNLGKDALNTASHAVDTKIDETIDEAKSNFNDAARTLGAAHEAISGAVDQKIDEAKADLNDAARKVGQAHDFVSNAIDQKIDREISEAKANLKEGLQTAAGMYQKAELANRVVDTAFVGVASVAGSAASSAINSIAGGVGETIVEQREAIEAALAPLQAAHDWISGPISLSDDNLGQITAKLFTTPASASIFAAGVALDVLEASPDIARALLEAKKVLPSKENFSELINELEPGQTRELSGELLVKVAAGLGVSVSTSRTIEISRNANDPHIIEITLKDADAGAVVVGKSVQGQGASLDAGLKYTDSVTLRFDSRDPAELTRARIATTAALFPVEPDTIANVFQDHLVSVRQELATSISGSAAMPSLPLGLDIGSTTTVAREHIRNDDVHIERLEIGVKPEASLGKDMIQLPKELFAELSQNAPDAASGTFAEIFASQTNGQVGLKASLAAEATLAVEIHNITPQTLEVDLKLTGDLAGPEHELHLKVTLHDLPELAKTLGRTPDDLARALSDGSTTLADLVALIGKPTDHLEIKLTRSTTTFEGTKINAMGLKFNHGTRQTSEEVLSHFGAREPEPTVDLKPFSAARHHNISI